MGSGKQIGISDYTDTYLLLTRFTAMKNQYQSKTSAEDSVDDLAEQIVDAAIRLAEKSSWESIRLHQVALELGIELVDVQRYYNQKDDLVEAWYDRADHAMLADAALPDYQWISPRERIHRSIMCWLMSMHSHRRVSRDMLMYKFELGHVHLQVLGLLRISRTVQWILESAHRDAVHLQRVTEETVLTGIYLASFAHWLFDDSNESENTRRFLDNLLRRAESLARLIEPISGGGCGLSVRAQKHKQAEPRHSVEDSVPQG